MRWCTSIVRKQRHQSACALKRKFDSGECAFLGQAKTDAVGACVVRHHQARPELVASVNAQVLRKRPPNRIRGRNKVAIPAKVHPVDIAFHKNR